MRYTPTLRLSNRLVAFVTIIVVSAMFILFVGGALSFKRLGQEYLDHSLKGIVDVLDKEMEDPDAAYSLQRWIPKMLQASNIVEMELLSVYGVIYRFKDTSSRVEPSLLYNAEYTLERNDGYRIRFKAVPPYIGYGYSIQALWSITFAVGLIVFCLVKGLNWLREQLYGSELLEERGRMILAGRVEEYSIGNEVEWPYTASLALDRLIEELQDARQERSRFDTFIRTQTFLDQLTGAANRVLFDSKLEAALSEFSSYGGVVILRVDDWEQIEEDNSKQIANDLIIEVGERLSNVIQRYPDVILSRYYVSDFAILAPNLSSKEVANMASHCLKQFEKYVPPSPLKKDNWLHIGLSMYREGEKQSRIIDEAETALKSAQLQQINTWCRFHKHVNQDEERGSVRWRTLFDLSLRAEKLHVFSQSCFLLDINRELHEDHCELLVRLNDPQTGLVETSRFNAAIVAVGYEKVLNKAVLQTLITHLKRSQHTGKFSVNLQVVPFAERSFFKWFRDELLQLTSLERSRIMFEFSEARTVKHLDYMRPIINMIAGLGCKVSISQAGKSIVSTHYIKELPIHYLKLHRSLVKRVDQRHENQLFIRSLLGACEGNKSVKVVAVGIESPTELQCVLDLGVDGIQGREVASEIQIWPPNETGVLKSSVSKVQIGRRNRWRKASHR
ncbi:RNase E specificity factor CsrD [Vibrio caribbeanicus]|uniref:Regulatory protein CsrD n=1 Tax=Vibrio caribbeanicus ATCC BAA-2122 TaxID=796620 RepID=E3BNT4_9VIBR|nr:RNase E specificity factor CsrD [Vibrio caribbeanicus]EFP95241.1 regulatory protein CsrD [Vibrio caribbeanicus ATCC BAA-2122]